MPTLFITGLELNQGLLADAEHLGAADGTNTLGSRLTIFHGDALGVLHFPLGATLDAIRLH